MQVEYRAVVSHVVAECSWNVDLSALEDLPAPRVQRGQFFGHAEYDFLDETKTAVFDIGQLHLTQKFFAQTFAGGVSVEQKLLFDIVAHLLAEPVTASAQLLTETAFGYRRALAKIGDLPIQVGKPHLFHDLAGIEALLGEHLDAAHVYRFTRGGHDDG